MSDYTPVHMYSGVMACIAQVLRESAISAVKPKSLREWAYIGGERGRNMSVEPSKFAHMPQVLEQKRNISVYARESERRDLCRSHLLPTRLIGF
jgi:hypothetical protein